MNHQKGHLDIRHTHDGSDTLYSSLYDSTYHSHHGAHQESQHVFIDAGLAYWKSLNPEKSACKIFEMGFGTGLNCFLALTYAKANNLDVRLDTIEKHPISLETHKELNHKALFDAHISEIDKIVQHPWNDVLEISNLTLTKIQDDFLHFDSTKKYDVIFYDAFGPGSQPELWSLDTCARITNLCQQNTILVTFCAQGQFKRNLKEVGFKVERLPGPPGKREITRAIYLG